MLGDDFWEERGFKPMSAGAYFKLSAIAVTGTIAAILTCSLVGSFIPIGLWFIGLSDYQRRRDSAWFGNTTFSRSDHPFLFAWSLGTGYLAGLAIIAFDIHRFTTSA